MTGRLKVKKLKSYKVDCTSTSAAVVMSFVFIMLSTSATTVLLFFTWRLYMRHQNIAKKKVKEIRTSYIEQFSILCTNPLFLTFRFDRASRTDSLICSLEFSNSDKRICRSAKFVLGSNKSSSFACQVFSMDGESARLENEDTSGSSSSESANAENAASLLWEENKEVLLGSRDRGDVWGERRGK